jgi:hypothetical protein
MASFLSGSKFQNFYLIDQTAMVMRSLKTEELHLKSVKPARRVTKKLTPQSAVTLTTQLEC